MQGRFPYETRWKYPHMLGEDVEVWDDFVKANPGLFDSVDYDVRVGDGTPAPDDWDENMKRMALAISQKRIDVVGWKDGKPTIIEVKDRATASTAGQIEGYRILWLREQPALPKPKILVVCSRIAADDAVIHEARHIPVIVV